MEIDGHTKISGFVGIKGTVSTKTIVWDGTETATVTGDGYLDVQTHTPVKCFAADYGSAQAAVEILTPTAGKKLRISQAYASTSTTTTDITLAFSASGNKFFKLYTANKTAQAGNNICATGSVNEGIKLTCGASTFVSVGYDEVT